MIEGQGSDLSHLCCYLCSGMHITLYISIKLILKLHHIEINLLNPSSKSRFLYKLQVDITWIIHPTKTQNDPWIFFLPRHQRVWNFLVFMSLSFTTRQLAPFASLQHIESSSQRHTYCKEGNTLLIWYRPSSLVSMDWESCLGTYQVPRISDLRVVSVSCYQIIIF